jgi:hypothetical protein
MIRNWEIIRQILLRLESTNTPNAYVDANSFDGYPEQEIAYNMRLLSEKGYIEAQIKSSSTGDGRINKAQASRLTNAGHDLLDTMRNETVWNKVKEKFTSNGIDMTFDLVANIGKKIIEAMIT